MNYPFTKHDGGRSTSTHPKERNDCTVRALALVTGVSYDDAFTMLTEDAGRLSNRGAWLDRWLTCRQDPAIGDPQDVFGFKATYRSFPAVKGQKRMNPATFHTMFPKGRFIVRTARHVFAVIDGVVHDIHAERPDRCIYSAWEFRTDHSCMNGDVTEPRGGGCAACRIKGIR